MCGVSSHNISQRELNNHLKTREGTNHNSKTASPDCNLFLCPNFLPHVIFSSFSSVPRPSSLTLLLLGGWKSIGELLSETEVCFGCVPLRPPYLMRPFQGVWSRSRQLGHLPRSFWGSTVFVARRVMELCAVGTMKAALASANVGTQITWTLCQKFASVRKVFWIILTIVSSRVIYTII